VMSSSACHYKVSRSVATGRLVTSLKPVAIVDIVATGGTVT
jgi:hypothetical protein